MAKEVSQIDEIVAPQTKGLVFQSSEIYGGLNGFSTMPTCVELRKNIKDAWWQDMVEGGMIWLVWIPVSL